jgi:hypothetical protein
MRAYLVPILIWLVLMSALFGAAALATTHGREHVRHASPGHVAIDPYAGLGR